MKGYVKQEGFTLIELIVVIVILGILAVTAAPKFIDLQGDARASALQLPPWFTERRLLPTRYHHLETSSFASVLQASQVATKTARMQSG